MSVVWLVFDAVRVASPAAAGRAPGLCIAPARSVGRPAPPRPPRGRLW